MMTRHPIANYLKNSLSTAPTWRYDYGLQRARRSKPPSSKDFDYWVRSVYWFGIRRLRGDPILEYDRRLIGVRKLFEAGGPITWEIEARTLAGETTAAIADKCGLPMETVLSYQRLFFGVEARLDQPHYIHQAIIQTRRPFAASDVAQLWKYFAYRGGPKVIDHIIDHFRRMDRPDYTSLLMDESPANQDKTPLDHKWELALKLQLTEFTASQAATLRDIVARQAEQVLPAQAPPFNSVTWMDRQLDVVLNQPPVAAPQKRRISRTG